MKINHNIYARYSKGPRVRLMLQFNWSEGGKQHKVNMPTGIKVLNEDWDNERKIIVASSEYSIPARDRMIAIQDFLMRLRCDSTKSYLAAARAFINYREVAPEKIVRSLRDFVNMFIENNLTKYSRNTIRRYRSLLVNISTFVTEVGGHDTFTAMDHDTQVKWFNDYSAWLIARGYRNPSIKQDFKLITSVRNAFTSTGILVDTSRVVDTLKDGDTRGVALTEEEMEQLWAAMNDTEMPEGERSSLEMFVFMCLTGLRISELTRLRREDVYVNEGIHVLRYTSEKTGTTNSVPLSPGMTAVFYMRQHEMAAASPARISRDVRRVMSRLPGFQSLATRVRFSGNARILLTVPRWKAITLHSARHTYSAIMSSGGMSMDDLGRMMNHGSSDTTRKHYDHADSSARIKSAYEILTRKFV